MSLTRCVLNLSLAVALACLLSSCGGGGSGSGNGGQSGPTFSVSANTMTFAAAAPTAAVPNNQPITGTVNGSVSGTLYMVAKTQPSFIETTSVFSGTGNSRQSTVTPLGPDLLNAGSMSGTITVAACVDDPLCTTGNLAGSPQTITVNYTVGSPVIPPDIVMPRIAVAGQSDSVVIRGRAFTGATSVRFGSNAAVSFSIISDTEIRAVYPALTAGTYAVTLNSGGIAFSGSIVAQTPIGYPAETLALPNPPTQITFLRYDAERRAILVGGSYFPSTTIPNKIWRFEYVGGSAGSVWSAPTTNDVPGLTTAIVSPDGSRILVLGNAGVVERSPDLLTALRTSPAPGSTGTRIQSLYSIAVANDGNAMIMATSDGVSPYPTYYYSLTGGTYAAIGVGFGAFPRGLAGAANGSRIYGGISGISPDQPIMEFNSSTGRRTFTIPSDQHGPIAISRDAGKIVVYAPSGFDNGARIFSGTTLQGKILGWQSINDLFNAVQLVTINPQGTRAFVLRGDSGTNIRALHTFALDQPTVGGFFPEVGSGTTLSVPGPSSMAITPDGGTLIIASAAGVLVMPAP